MSTRVVALGRRAEAPDRDGGPQGAPESAPTSMPPAAPARDEAALAAALVARGTVPAHLMLHALARQRRHGGSLVNVLLGHGLAEPAPLYAAFGRLVGAPVVDPARLPPDPALLARLGGAAALRAGVLPWRRAGARTVVLAPDPAAFAAARPDLEAAFGAVDLALAPAAEIERAVLAVSGPALADAAASTVQDHLSSRRLGAGGAHRAMAAAAAVAVLALWLAPLAVAAALFLAALAAVLASTVLKTAALLATLRAPDAARRTPPPALADAALPMVSVIVALFREADIAPRLVRRLERLDYPRDRLEVLLAVEADDSLTRGALARSRLPPWMRVVVVPGGPPRTKPRALNHALGLCRGALVGVYDAEDAPAPDQLRRVAAAFAEAPPEVACLQGVLDFYNPRENWMARMFTLEYAAWFRLVLPGVARLGLPVPLGGTTLFFRREVLQALGAWDAWNVTEDADLGLRLARAGWRTQLIDSVTLEEANCRPWAWVRQRSRWIKGYMVTWAVHMRRPAQLRRDLGTPGFAGFQAMFLGSFTQALLAPLVWSFWFIPLGLPHPATGLPGGALVAVIGLFIAAEVAQLAVGWVALRRRGGGLSPLWLPLHHLYFPLATLGAFKALHELVAAPFYWDKTAHGRPARPLRRRRERPAARPQPRSAAAGAVAGRPPGPPRPATPGAPAPADSSPFRPLRRGMSGTAPAAAAAGEAIGGVSRPGLFRRGAACGETARVAG